MGKCFVCFCLFVFACLFLLVCCVLCVVCCCCFSWLLLLLLLVVVFPGCCCCCCRCCCRCCCCCLVVAWLLPGCCLVVACFLPVCCLFVACLLPGCCLVVAWLVPGWCLVGAWLVPGWCLVGAWLVPGWCLVGAWLVPGWCLVGAWLLFVCVVGVFWSSPPDPPPPEGPSPGPPKISLFFFSLPPEISFFLLSLGVFSLNFGGVFGRPEPLNVHGLSCETTAASGPSGLHTTTRELQTCTFNSPSASKHHQNSTRRPPERQRVVGKTQKGVEGKNTKRGPFVSLFFLRSFFFFPLCFPLFFPFGNFKDVRFYPIMNFGHFWAPPFFKMSGFYTPPEIFVNFGRSPLLQLLEALFWPKRRPKILNFCPTRNFGHSWASLVTLLIFRNFTTHKHLNT